MKIRIDVDPNLDEKEVVIKCPEIDESVVALQSLLLRSENEKSKIVFYKNETEYYLPIDKILFFETSDDQVWAHTCNDEFSVKYKLYELEDILPRQFVRISKSAILNSGKVYSIVKNLTASSKVEFAGSNKSVFVSRSYYRLLKEKLSPGEGK